MTDDLSWHPQPGMTERGKPANYYMPIDDGWRDMKCGRRWRVNWFLAEEKPWPLPFREPYRHQEPRK